MARPQAPVDRDEAVDALVQSAYATMAVLNRVAAENDFSLTQLRALAILRGRHLRMSELAEYLGLDRSTLSGLIDRAEQRGLVVRESDPSDGRAIVVSLSAEGKRLATRINAQVRKALEPLLDRA